MRSNQYDWLQTPRLLLWDQRGLLEEEVDEELRVLFGTPWYPLVVMGLHAPAMELLAGEGEQLGEELVLLMGLQPKDTLHTLPDLPLQFTNKHHYG